MPDVFNKQIQRLQALDLFVAKIGLFLSGENHLRAKCLALYSLGVYPTYFLNTLEKYVLSE